MPLTSSSQTQHAIGALLGSAVGDALGAPFEFQPGGRYSARFPRRVLGGAGEMVGGGPWAPGEFTDDTHMALALAESLVAQGRLHPEDLWARWRAWAADAKDVGILTRQALSCSTHDGAAAHAHRANGGKSAGNGSLMRNTPVALFMLRGATTGSGAADPASGAIALSQAQSRLTHHDPANDEGVAIHTGMLRAAILGRDMFAALDEAVATLEPAPRERWRVLLDESWKPSDAEFGNGTVWTCLAQAVWAVRRAQDFEEAVRLAVDLGDDADTVACVAGSLAGARWGVQAIPSRWSTYVHGSMRTADGRVARYDNAALQDLARRLLGLGPVPSAAPDHEPGGPTRVHDECPVHAAELEGAKTAPREWAVVSLCRTDGAFHAHPVRREVFLIDQYNADANANVDAALADAVDAIDALLAERSDRPVVVHCHGGRSRTALVLKAWAMRRHGWSESEADEWLRSRWPRAHSSNPVFAQVLRERWPGAARDR
jgi:ADP-ribosyl-[dinitrogen reductase] hydrolase